MAVYEFDLSPETTAKDVKARLAAFILLYGECGYIQLRGPVVTLFKGQMLPANYNSAAAVKKIGRSLASLGKGPDGVGKNIVAVVGFALREKESHSPRFT